MAQHVDVTKNGIIPAVIYLGTEGSGVYQTEFSFSEDWDGLTKEIIFYDTRGNIIVSPANTDIYRECVIEIPNELTMWGGPHKFTARGYTIDAGYLNDVIQVTGTIVTTYAAGKNPRLEGRILPSTLDLFLYQAQQAMESYLADARDSGEFDGADGRDGHDGTAAGFGTPNAYAVSLSQDSDPTVSVSATGPDTAKVFTFTFGIPKSVGKNFTILGHYASLATLQAAVPYPEVGDAYSVGANTPYNIYVYDGVSHAWVDYGPLGSGGSSITVDTVMSDVSTNAVQNNVIKAYADALAEQVSDQIPTSLKNPYKLTAYGQQYDGSIAVTLTADSVINASTAQSTKPVSTKAVKDYVDDLIGDIDAAISDINLVVGTPKVIS